MVKEGGTVESPKASIKPVQDYDDQTGRKLKKEKVTGNVNYLIPPWHLS